MDGKYNGFGVLEYQDGSKYQGEFKDDEFEGIGKRIYNDGASYEGNFLKGEFHGHGIWHYPNGDILEGNWENGDRNGVFIKTKKKKKKFNVEYKNDVKEKEEKVN